MYRLNCLLLLALPFSLLADDLSWNLGLKSTLGRGEQLGHDYSYLENFISGSAEMGPWYLDLSLESSQPPEYGYEYQGVDRFYLSYIDGTRSLELGDISAVFGRGLALNLDENQAIDFDNEILGFRFSTLIMENHELDLLAGVREEYRFYSPSSQLREPDGLASYDLVGAEVTLNSSSGQWSTIPYVILSRMRSDFVWQSLDRDVGTIRTDTVSQQMNALQGGWGQSIYGGSWDLYFEYNQTWKGLDYPLANQNRVILPDGQQLVNSDSEYTQSGRAFNLQLNWFPEWFTALFEYKRYLNGPESSAQKRNPLLLATKPLPWQMGPTGIREHDISLLGNVTHAIDYGDELGWNLEVRKSLTDNLSVVVNGGQISQSSPVGEPGWVPTSALDQNPWEEYYADFEYSGPSFYQRMLIAFTSSTLSGQNTAEVMEHYTFVPAYMSWYPNDVLILSSMIELQRSRVMAKTFAGSTLDSYDYQSGHFIASADYVQKYSLAVIWDTSNDPGLDPTNDGYQHWVSGEISVKSQRGLWLRASYGKEKGGVRCTGGVCRILSPFEGFRVAVEWRL